MAKRGRPPKKAPQTVEEWLQRYPGELNFLIPFFVRQPEKIHEILRVLCEKDLFARVGASGWEAYFVKPPRWGSILSYVYEFAGNGGEDAQFDIKAALRHKNDFKKRFHKDFIEVGREMREETKFEQIDAEKVPADFLAGMEQLVELELADDDPFARTVFTHPAVIFLLSVSFPCWIMYQQTVEELLDLVKGGCAESLVKLLRLDRRFMENPIVRSAYLTVLGDEKHPWREEVNRAPANPEKKDISLTSIKYSIAGLIIEFAEQANQHCKRKFRAILDQKHWWLPDDIRGKLTTLFAEILSPKISIPAVQELFGIAAQEIYGQVNDPYLAKQPDSFANTVRRYRSHWNKQAFFPAK